jgi:hypothetical protein
VVVIPDTSGMHIYQAAIIGLVEGFLCFDSITEYLEGVGCGRQAKNVIRDIAHIKVCAQARLPNFSKIPLAGSVFQKKHDLWPIKQKPSGVGVSVPSGVVILDDDWL